MTQNEIIQMAKVVGFSDEEINTCQLMLEHFAKLVAQHECNEIIQILDDSTGYVQMDLIRERLQ